MLKKLACLLFLVLAVGCTPKSQSSSPEAVLAEISGGYWKLDVDASLDSSSSGKESAYNSGYEEDIRHFAESGFILDAQNRIFYWYAPQDKLQQKLPFTVAPEAPEDTAAREKGIRQVRLLMEGYVPTEAFLLRCEKDGKVAFFIGGKPFAIFSRLEE